MKTYQLKFLAWVFSAFLPPDDPDAERDDYYELLGVAPNANADDIKKAYRKRSLQLHPDKLRQRGMRYNGEVITEDEARSRFQHMKAAYDTLSDPKKRQVYDALGHRGMDVVNNPSHAYDPHVLISNLAKSSVFDRAKLMALVVVFFGLVLLQPILICAKIDQMLAKDGGALEDASWVALLVPFWIFAVCYGALLVIGALPRLRGGSVDYTAALPLLSWISFVLGVLFLTLKFDNAVSWTYAGVFIPFYFWMFFRLVEAWKDRRDVTESIEKMVTIEYIEKYVINETKQDEGGNDIEDQLHRHYNDLNEEERDKINEDHIIVHVPPKPQAPGTDEVDEEDEELERIERSPEYQEAKARHEIANKSIWRIILPEIPLIVLVIVHLDQNKDWNWGVTFLPLWLAMFFECCGGCYHFFCTSALARIELQEQMQDHFAKEQGDKTTPDGDEETGEAEKEENGEEAKSEDAAGEKPNTDEADEAGKDGKSTPDKPAEIDTAVTVETPAKEMDATKPASKTDDAIEKEVSAMKAKEIRDELQSYGISTVAFLEKSELVDALVEARKEGKSPVANDKPASAEVPDDDDEDDGFIFEMDEDTFHFYQQAEQEAETKATEAQSKAIGSFCNIIFQTLIAALFVAKLNQVYEEEEQGITDGTSSYSTFWILFPFLLIAGCIVSCFACAIFGASGIDNVLATEDGDESGDGEGEGETAAAAAAAADTNAASPVVMPPPPLPVFEKPPEDTNASNGQAPAVVEETADPPADAPPAEEEDIDDLD
ncbi:hypothetical protein ACHAXT_003094 [Thalassiosira profunda]